MKVYYIANVWDTDNLDIEDAEYFETDRDIHSAKGNGYDEWEIEWLVDEISKYYFNNRDGWEIERSWRDGIVIALWDDRKNFVGKFESVLEYEPSFMISKVKE
jgi:hypothetical protein